MNNPSVVREYLSLFESGRSLLAEYGSAVMDCLRNRAAEAFEKNGFPETNHEDYRYTNVISAFEKEYGLNLKRLPFKINPKEVFSCDVPSLNTDVRFIINDVFYRDEKKDGLYPNGVFVGSLRRFCNEHPEIASRYLGKIANVEKDFIASFNTMFFQDGVAIFLPKNTVIESPVQIVNILRSTVDLLCNRRILVILEDGAQVKLLSCDHSLGSQQFLSTEVVEIFAGKGANLDFYDLEESSQTTQRFTSFFIDQEEGANVLVNGVTLNNGLTRNNYYINLNGPYASSIVGSMAITDQNQKVDVFTHINHNAPNCHSNQLVKNVLDGESTGAFSGRIYVKQGALKTEAYQNNRNLCLRKTARMFSKPQLEIYADDVKCSHGMTTGQIDEDALFYMRSRGISQREARLMLSVAFMSEVIDLVRIDTLKERLHELVSKRFKGELARCSNCTFCGEDCDVE